MGIRAHRQWQVFDGRGQRKYLNRAERDRLLSAADRARPDVRALCYLLVFTGCRISEALALIPENLHADAPGVTFRTLKRRHACFRTVPVPRFLLLMLSDLCRGSLPIWPMHRSTAWRQLKRLYAEIAVAGPMACCKGLRHGFGIHAASTHVPPNLIQRWMGHAYASTTAIYLDAIGAEERQFAERMW